MIELEWKQDSMFCGEYEFSEPMNICAEWTQKKKKKEFSKQLYTLCDSHINLVSIAEVSSSQTTAKIEKFLRSFSATFSHRHYNSLIEIVQTEIKTTDALLLAQFPIRHSYFVHKQN